MCVCLIRGHGAQIPAVLEGTLTNRGDGIGELNCRQFRFALKDSSADLGYCHTVNNVGDFDACYSSTFVLDKDKIVRALDPFEYEVARDDSGQIQLPSW